MFLPSESIYSEINIRFPKLVNESRNKKVYMAGPDNLMLLLHTVRAILRDATMSQTAGKIQIEVDKCNLRFGKWEQIKRFELTSNIWSIENDHLTPTMKMKRSVILKIHQNLVDKIYK